jgi:hypothetical protein
MALLQADHVQPLGGLMGQGKVSLKRDGLAAGFYEAGD